MNLRSLGESGCIFTPLANPVAKSQHLSFLP